MRRLFTLLLIGILPLLAACAEEGSPTEAVEAYLQARTESDEDAIRQLTCAAQEAQVPTIAASFAAFDVSLQDVSCERGDEIDGFTVVTCEGNFFFDYGQETQELAVGNYRTTQEDGEWKVCGEAG